MTKRLGPKVKLTLLVGHKAGCCKETRPDRHRGEGKTRGSFETKKEAGRVEERVEERWKKGRTERERVREGITVDTREG